MNKTVTFPAKKLLWGVSKNGKSKLYAIQGKEIWIPVSLSTFVPDSNQGDPLSGNGDTKGMLTVEKWYWDKKKNMIETLEKE